MSSVLVRDIAEVRGGGTPRKSVPKYFGGGIPWVTPKDMKRWLIGESEVTLTLEGVENSPAKIVPPGSVLLVVRSGVLKHTLPVALTTTPVTLNQDMKALIPSRAVDGGYLARLVKARQKEVLGWVRATTADNFPIEKSLDLQIDLPRVDQQRRIAAILDQADALRAKRRQVLAHLDALTQAIFREMFGSSESSAPLGELCALYSGGTPSKSQANFWSGTLPWFSPKDLKFDDLRDSQDHISERIPNESSLRLLPADTVVVVVRGMILAHTLPVSVLRVPATINQDLKALVPRQNVNVDFLAAAIRSHSNSLLAQVGTAAHGTRKLETSILQSVTIPIVCEKYQSEFARRVRTIDGARARMTCIMQKDEKLFASIQSHVFSGELRP